MGQGVSRHSPAPAKEPTAASLKPPKSGGGRESAGSSRGGVKGSGGSKSSDSPGRANHADPISSYILAATSFLHAVQAERGSSCVFSASCGEHMASMLHLVRAVTDEAWERLTQTAVFHERESSFSKDELDIMRLRVDSTIPFLECFRMYTIMAERLLAMIATGTEKLRNSETGSLISAYLTLLTLKEYTGRERALVGGLLCADGKFPNPKVYAFVLSIHGSQRALSYTFQLTSPKDVSEMYRKQVSVMPREIATLSERFAESMQAAEELMSGFTPEHWFEIMTHRMDLMERIQQAMLTAIHKSLGSDTASMSTVLTAPLLPAWEKTIQKNNNSDRGARTSDFDNYGKTFIEISSTASASQVARIEFKEQIGTGMSGPIFSGTLNANKVAIKVCETTGPDGEEVEDKADILREFVREVSVVSVMRHPNIVRFLGSSLRPPRYAMVLEFLDGGTLWSALRQERPSVKFFDMAIQFASGLKYIHEVAGLIHRDLKTPNLLLTNNGVLKIADFGLCCLGDEGQKNQFMEVGTLRWMAPEILLHKNYDLAADIYSFAIILWEVLTKQVPYIEMQVAGHINKATMVTVAREHMRPKLPKGTPKTIHSLITSCWHPDPFMRPKIGEVLQILEEAEPTMKLSDKEFLQKIHPVAGVERFQT